MNDIPPPSPPRRQVRLPSRWVIALALIALSAMMYVTIFYKVAHYGP